MVRLILMEYCNSCGLFDAMTTKSGGDVNVRCANFDLCNKVYNFAIENYHKTSEATEDIRSYPNISSKRLSWRKMLSTDEFLTSFKDVKSKLGLDFMTEMIQRNTKLFSKFVWSANNTTTVALDYIPNKYVDPDQLGWDFIHWVVFYSTEYGIYPKYGMFDDSRCDCTKTPVEAIKFMNQVEIKQWFMDISHGVRSMSYYCIDDRFFIKFDYSKISGESGYCFSFDKNKLLSMEPQRAIPYLSSEFGEAFKQYTHEYIKE